MFLTFFNDFLSQQKGLSVPVATMVRRPLLCVHVADYRESHRLWLACASTARAFNRILLLSNSSGS